MLPQVFDRVWYLPAPNRWRDLNILAYRDVGTLTINADSMQFEGRGQTIVVRNVRNISYGRQGRDFINKWVRVEYATEATPAVAFFADGSWMGWGGIFGGTKKLLDAARQAT